MNRIAQPSGPGFALEVKGASKRFGARQVLSDIELSVRAGERVALLGASGSGKSTLLRCICGLERLSGGRGEVRLHGRSMHSAGRLAADARALRQQVGVVFQQFNLVGRLSVLSNVLVGAAARAPAWRWLSGRYSREERAAAWLALDRLGLAEQAFQRASTLSGGQQQRAAIARTLVQRARLVLADEPVASLDPASTQRVMDHLLELNRRDGTTLVVSLHHVALARRYCTRAVALRDGVVVFDGPIEQLTSAAVTALYGQAADQLLADDAHRPVVEPVPTAGLARAWAPAALAA